MYHTPPPRPRSMVSTRSAVKREAQQKAAQQDTQQMEPSGLGKMEPPGLGKKSKKSSVSSHSARKKRLEFEAAQAKASIRMELIDKKLDADLAELEDEGSVSSSSSSKEASEFKDREVEKWLESSRQKVKTQSVIDDELCPAPQESNLHRLGAAGPPPSVAELALAARPPPPIAGGTDDTVHALASALKDLAAVSAAGTSRSNDKLLNRLCTPRDLPKYSGDPLEWLQFKQAFEESTQVCNFSDKENLWRLRKSLDGPAKEAVTALLIGSTSASDVMTTLELQFGNPDVIIAKILQDINKLRPISQEYQKEIIPFSVKVRNCVAAVTAIGREDYLKGMSIVPVILSKLPIVLFSKWTDYSYRRMEEKEKPKFVILSEFLNEEAEKITKTSANLPTLYNFGKQSFADNYKQHRALLVNNEQSGDSETCRFCRVSKHLLKDCKKFIKTMRRDRWAYVKQYGICFKCLTSRHKQATCSAPACDVNNCGQPHHRLLHYVTDKNKNSVSNSDSVNITDVTENETESHVETVNNMKVSSSKVLLKTVPVYLHGPNGVFRCDALLDDGSTITLINAALAMKIGLRGRKQTMRVSGPWDNSDVIFHSEVLDLDLSNCEGTRFAIRARSVQNLNLPVQNVDAVNLSKYYELKPEIKSAINNGQCKPELLIGQDNYDLLLPLEILKGKPSDPYFTRTPLGWCVHGCVQTKYEENSTQSTLFLSENTEQSELLRQMHDEMRHYFTIESMGIAGKPRRSVLEIQAEEKLEKTATLKDGRWYVGLPWKDTFKEMPNSYDNALSRLKGVERKMKVNDGFATRYKQRIDHLFDNDYASELIETINPERIWYLSHFGVDNPNKLNLRLVFDAAAKVQGSCLNDYLLKGSDLLMSLYGIMLRFRENKVAVTADIKDMFLRIKIRKEDRDALRFLWRESPEEPVKTYVMTSLIFGANCSPFIAQFVKNKNAERFETSMPEAVQAIYKQHYMDDYIDSIHDEKYANQLVNDVTNIHKQGGFEIRNWTSNIQSVLRDLPKESLSSTSVTFKDGEQHKGERTLGLIWFPTEDKLGFDVSFKRIPSSILTGQKKPTKREMLRVVMSIFDVFGFLSPILIKGKIMLQDTFKFGIDWDDEITDPIFKRWTKWINLMKEIDRIRLPRHYESAVKSAPLDNKHMCETHESLNTSPTVSAPLQQPSPERYKNLQLHIFCDASAQAMCAVAYWRWIDFERNIQVAFVSSKCRVAPVKYVSMPRLELQAAVMAGRLADNIISEHRMKAESKIFWCDSSTVLHWIRNNVRNYKAYIAHRLGELDELTKIDEWRHIPTKLNIWPKGVIQAVLAGKDGRIRVVVVLTKAGVLRRNATRVARIHLEDECCDSTREGNVGDA